MRILYIEDIPDWEFMKAIFRKTIFNLKTIGSDLISQLDYEANSTERRGLSPREIKDKIAEDFNDHLVLCHHFEDAMYYVTSQPDTFDLFIIDRNLKYLDGSANFEKLKSIDPRIDESIIEKYTNREGDWILSTLATQTDVDTRKQVFFVTANDDPTIFEDANQNWIEQGLFNEEEQRFIKGEEGIIEKLVNIIRSYPINQLEDDFSDIFEIIDRKSIDKNARKRYTTILKNRKKPAFLNQIRQFIDNDIIGALEKSKKAPPDRCRNFHGLSLSRFHDWLIKEDYLANIYFDYNNKRLKFKKGDFSKLEKEFFEIKDAYDALNQDQISDKELDEKRRSIDPNNVLKKFPIQEKAYKKFLESDPYKMKNFV